MTFAWCDDPDCDCTKESPRESEWPLPVTFMSLKVYEDGTRPEQRTLHCVITTEAQS